MKRIALLIITLLPLAIFADDFFDDVDSFGDESSSSSSLEVNGTVTVGATDYINEDGIDGALESTTDGEFTVKYLGEVGDVTIIADLDQDGIALNECYTNIYFDNFSIDAGLLKTIWGKGDKLHVVDLLNPIDYNTYFTEDYLDNKIARLTFKANVPVGESGVLELAYLPTFKGDNVPTDGRWSPLEAQALKSVIEAKVTTDAVAAYAATYLSTYAYYTGLGKDDATADVTANGAASLAELQTVEAGMDMSSYYTNTDTFAYGQGGARFTNSFNGFDYGLLYYYGYESRPELTAEYKLEYNKLQMFGAEFGGVLAGFNLRGEGAYYLIDNKDDTLNYVAGFDRDIPLHNINMNVQVKGDYTMESEELNNLLVGKLSDNFNHEKLTVSVTGIYNIDDEDYMVKPEVEASLGDNIKVKSAAGLFYGDDDTMFGSFEENNFVSLKVEYAF